MLDSLQTFPNTLKEWEWKNLQANTVVGDFAANYPWSPNESLKIEKIPILTILIPWCPCGSSFPVTPPVSVQPPSIYNMSCQQVTIDYCSQSQAAEVTCRPEKICHYSTRGGKWYGLVAQISMQIFCWRNFPELLKCVWRAVKLWNSWPYDLLMIN